MLLLMVGSIYFAGSANAGLILSTQPVSQTIPLGSTFTLNVMATGARDLYAFQFDVGFDPTLLFATQVTEGSFLQTGGATFSIPPAIDNTAGNISNVADSLLTAITGVDGNGVLSTITFRSIKAGNSAITIFNTTFLDSSLS